MEFEELKSHLKASFKVIGWEPTDDEMREIAQKIRENKPKTVPELWEIVQSVRPFGLQHAFEGADNTDLNLLLLMATKLAQPK
jgi:hypothetical protein